MTADHALSFLNDPATAASAIETLRKFDITRMYVEVYRGTIVPPDVLARVRDYFVDNGIAVTGGIATVPGDDTGVAQVGPLDWFNFQNPKTQSDLKKIMQDSAPVFDEFIVDDFLCTGDVSEESARACGERSWGEYRLELMAEVAREVFIQPAKEANPDITMIIKYPQWYDRFHLFGYDVPTQSAQFDATFVGTETRGARTQRFGFTQPYEGFVNYRWIQSIAGSKARGAWFDHGDCDGPDFLEQAYQTVLAGAPEIVLFSCIELLRPHPGHELLIAHQDRLRQLAEFVAKNPVSGIAAYKPPNSDPGPDMYLFDFLGMLGIPLVPVSAFPEDSEVIFLPTQAAADPDIESKTIRASERGARIVMTAGFLAQVKSDRLIELAGIATISAKGNLHAQSIEVDGASIRLAAPLDLEAELGLGNAAPIITTRVNDALVPLLTATENKVYVLNTHTYSQADFDAVGEVLLSPRPLGLLDLPEEVVNTIRAAFIEPLPFTFEAPPRVAIQPMGPNDWFIHNYREDAAFVTLTPSESAAFSEVYTGANLVDDSATIRIGIPQRDRVWLRNLR